MAKFRIESEFETPSGSGSLQSGIKVVTRDISSPGTQDVTGFGFNPTSCQVSCNLEGDSGWSIGFADTTGQAYTAQLAGSNNTTTAGTGYAAYISTSGSAAQFLGAFSFITDGVRIIWTKVGPPAGTAKIVIRGLR